MNRFSLLVFILALPLLGWGQTISNVRATFTGGKVTVTYDLTGGSDKQQYNVALYSSHDNYGKPVLSVSGDVGGNKDIGAAKRIVWDAQVDLGEYNGALTFRVSADPILLAYSFTKPANASSYRRGKEATITWEGGSQSDNITIELVKDGSTVQQISNTRNSGLQNWSVPKEMAKGTGYQLRLRSSNGQNVTSDLFAIKSKIPLALKIAPVVLVAGVVAVLAGGGGGGGEPTGSLDLPAAPAAPN